MCLPQTRGHSARDAHPSQTWSSATRRWVAVVAVVVGAQHQALPLDKLILVLSRKWERHPSLGLQQRASPPGGAANSVLWVYRDSRRIRRRSEWLLSGFRISRVQNMLRRSVFLALRRRGSHQ